MRGQLGASLRAQNSLRRGRSASSRRIAVATTQSTGGGSNSRRELDAATSARGDIGSLPTPAPLPPPQPQPQFGPAAHASAGIGVGLTELHRISNRISSSSSNNAAAAANAPNNTSPARHGAAAGPSFPPLPSSVLVRRNMGWSAARWCAAGILTTALTLWILLSQDAECIAGNRAVGMMSIWVAVSTSRIAMGGLLRGGVWALWNVRLLPEQQPPSVFVLVRCEFILMLLSVMWTTIGACGRFAGFLALLPAARLSVASPLLTNSDEELLP